jgi:hypothetical protein
VDFENECAINPTNPVIRNAIPMRHDNTDELFIRNDICTWLSFCYGVFSMMQNRTCIPLFPFRMGEVRM